MPAQIEAQHDFATGLDRMLDQLVSLSEVQRQRFFKKQMLSRVQDRQGNLDVELHRHTDCDGFYHRVFKEGTMVEIATLDVKSIPRLLETILIKVGHGHDFYLGDISERGQMRVRSRLSTTDQPYPQWFTVVHDGLTFHILVPSPVIKGSHSASVCTAASNGFGG